MSEIKALASDSLTANDVLAQVQRIQQVMAQVMTEGQHYGEIPGMKAKKGEAKKFVLLKPGAEKIMLTFRISNELRVEDLSGSDERRYRVTARAIHIQSGQMLGEGVGEASTSEEKYKWRAAVCVEEFEESPADRRREKWSKGWDRGPYKTQQVRTNPEDLANTVLKMAKKRALVDMVLTVTAASDIFTQDLDENDVDSSNSPTPQPAEIKKNDSAPTFGCSDCGVVITPTVNDFSTKKHGRPLCMECQKK
jgi:hypothetical protein